MFLVPSNILFYNELQKVPNTVDFLFLMVFVAAFLLHCTSIFSHLCLNVLISVKQHAAF